MNLTGTLIYDELPMVTSFYTWMEGDTVFGDVKALNLNIH